MKHRHAFATAATNVVAACTLFFTFVLVFGAGSASAQNARIKHKIVSENHVPPQLGRDLWFSMIQNYEDQSGKYYALYVTSPKNTTAYVQSGGFVKSLAINAYSVAVFNIPLGWEIKSSGVVEDKAIHVWSKDADLSCYL